ncbi:hypothetical protein TcasGA2_TC006267 [Tribolium castaneum]|uniref:Uncharacterized protein n=1 Tax=Tribolium castaneum TaxID=7070 RepID=D6WVR4_TRICA|nr:hypothetical protein TcasGA2_TC006267 [Tribolium castaneum]
MRHIDPYRRVEIFALGKTALRGERATFAKVRLCERLTDAIFTPNQVNFRRGGNSIGGEAATLSMRCARKAGCSRFSS